LNPFTTETHNFPGYGDPEVKQKFNIKITPYPGTAE
jgi:hypothetical protein